MYVQNKVRWYQQASTLFPQQIWEKMHLYPSWKDWNFLAPNNNKTIQSCFPCFFWSAEFWQSSTEILPTEQTKKLNFSERDLSQRALWYVWVGWALSASVESLKSHYIFWKTWISNTRNNEIKKQNKTTPNQNFKINQLRSKIYLHQ